jgi:hypothetical protein
VKEEQQLVETEKAAIVMTVMTVMHLKMIKHRQPKQLGQNIYRTDRYL